MATLTRPTASNPGGTPGYDASNANQFQDLLYLTNTTGYNVQNQRYVSREEFAPYGFDDLYGTTLTQRYLNDRAFVGEYQPISNLWYNIANEWNYTGQQLVSGNVGVSIDWEIGHRQAIMGTPEYARKLIRDNDPALHQLYAGDPFYFKAGELTSPTEKRDYLIQNTNVGSQSWLVNNTAAFGADISRTGKAANPLFPEIYGSSFTMKVSPVQATGNDQIGYVGTLSETLGAFSVPQLRENERFMHPSQSGGTGTILGPVYSLPDISTAQRNTATVAIKSAIGAIPPAPTLISTSQQIVNQVSTALNTVINQASTAQSLGLKYDVNSQLNYNLNQVSTKPTARTIGANAASQYSYISSVLRAPTSSQINDYQNIIKYWY